MDESKNKKFLDFVKASIGQKEVSLVIAQNMDEFVNYSSTLQAEGFKGGKNIKEAFNVPKVYFSVDANMPKDMYDFMTQYSTGQVEIFDKVTRTSKTFSPDYDNNCVLYLVLKEDISFLQKNGWDLLSNTGLAYQE